MSARQPKRALLVIDVQNEYVSGNLRIEFPAIQSSLERIGAAMDAAHAAGIPIVVVQHLAPADSPLFARGSRQAELHEVVARGPTSTRWKSNWPVPSSAPGWPTGCASATSTPSPWSAT